MEKMLERFKIVATAVLSGVFTALGGYDRILALLISLIIADLLTGLINAVMTKTLNSTALRDGLLRKGLVFLVVFLAFQVDRLVLETSGTVPSIGGIKLSVRTLFIAYSCIEEGISLLENLANIGVPVPRWVKDILVQVSNCTNKSAPKEFIAWIERTFNISIGIGKGNTDEPKNETDKVEQAKESDKEKNRQ